MPSIETLQAKRVALVASQDHLVGQINRVGGAIAVIDELINEEQASQAMPTVPEYMRADPRLSPSAPPEMIPVSRFTTCDDCSTAPDCELVDMCRLKYVGAYTANESDPA